MKPDFSLELSFIEQGKSLVAGVDEVGRGALAGPIVAAAVIFQRHEAFLKDLAELNDSKVLSDKKRRELAVLIKEKAHAYNIAEISPELIDRFGIGAANIMAFEKALEGLRGCDFALIDGRKFHGFSFPYCCLEKGDSKSISIAAASIIAKVYRDDLMIKYDQKYPGYSFADNKGYAAAIHIDRLKKVGQSEIHRKSFLNFMSEAPTLF